MDVVINGQGGNTSISSDVISAIAGTVTLNSYGIVGMAARKMSEDWAELLGIENISRGVGVDITDNSVTISLHVIVKYGVAINVVADNIISAVRYTVENLTGVQVAWIKFFVEGVRL